MCILLRVCCSIVCTAISFAPLPFECLFSASNLSNSFMAAFRLLSSSARCYQIYKWSILFKGIDHVGCPPLYEIDYEPEDLFRRHPVLHHRRCDCAQVSPEIRNEHFYHLGFQRMFWHCLELHPNCLQVSRFFAFCQCTLNITRQSAHFISVEARLIDINSWDSRRFD